MKLELKYLAPYLPYGLKALSIDGFSVSVLGVDFTTNRILNINGDITFTIPEIKPLLRPLLDLTKEIEINGEKFVPIVELAKIAYPDLVWEFDRTRAISEWKKEPAYFFFQKNSFFACLFNNAIPNQIVLFNKLFEWHFDVFGLIDQRLARPLI